MTGAYEFSFFGLKIAHFTASCKPTVAIHSQICAYLCGKVCAFTNFRFQILNAVVTAICFSTVTSSGHYGDKISALDIVTIALVSLRIFGHRFFFSVASMLMNNRTGHNLCLRAPIAVILFCGYCS